MIEMMGILLGQRDTAMQLNRNISSAFHKISLVKFPETIYLIWKKPWMAAGKETFINDMLIRVGFENRIEGRYPEITDVELSKAKIILLSSEPYPFSEKHRQELQELYPDKTIILVDGEMFSWYGSRLLLAADYFKELQLKVGKLQ
jgi:ABC-type Fe3+-hydroxamate transport system substrate-binding protein